MMTKKEIQEWLDTLDDDATVAIDEGGLCLVEVEEGEETGSYFEVGGIPEEEFLDEDEDELEDISED